MGNENFQIIELDESRFIVYLIKWQILKYCTKTTSLQMWLNNDRVLCTIIGWKTPELKRGEMDLRRKRYMVHSTNANFKERSSYELPSSNRFTMYINTYSTLSVHNFSTCQSFKTYDAYWDSILLFFIILKVSSITCPVKLSET